MTKGILFLGISFFSFFLLAAATGAATEDSVSCTVTVQNFACALTTDGAVAYLTLTTSAVKDTCATGVDDSEELENTGNVNSDFDIKGSDSTSWTLAGAIGDETFMHRWCVTDCDGTPVWTAMTAGYVQIATGVAAGGKQLFDMEMNTPSSTVNFTEQTTVTWLQCSAT